MRRKCPGGGGGGYSGRSSGDGIYDSKGVREALQC